MRAPKPGSLNQESMLITGGSGLLGTELKRILPGASYPLSNEFDVTNYDQMQAFIKDRAFRILVHAAAFTSPPQCEREPIKALENNIIGTANVVELAVRNSLRLVYVSTDYVFRGTKGNYQEDDDLHPVNKYAWSKLGGECAVRLNDNSLIIRMSFGPNECPYEAAFVDQWTSRQPVRTIAQTIAGLIDHPLTGVIHIGGPRRTVYEYAKSLDPHKDIKKLSRRDVTFEVPADTSLNCDLFNRLTGTEQTEKKEDA